MSEDSTERFANLELDLTQLTAPATHDDIGNDISDTGRDRAQGDEDLAVASGFAPQPPLYAIGTRINQVGVANLKRSRVDFDNLPSVQSAMNALAAKVQSEDRQDIKVDLTAVTMTDSGNLKLEDGTELLLARNGFRVMAHRIVGSYDYLKRCPPKLRAANMNHWLPDASSSAVLRTRANGKNREVFSVVSPRYKPLDVDQVAECIAKIAPPDARCEVVYDGLSLTASVLFHTDIDPGAGVAGEFFKAGVRISTRDDGTGSLNVEAELWRNLCLNLIILDRATQRTARRNHVGAGLEIALNNGIEQALSHVGGFAARWTDARLENVLENYDLQNIDQVFERLAQNRVIHVPGVKPEEVQERLHRAWQQEPGYSRADIVNAITRAAHENPWGRLDTTEELEREAGQLLYARNWHSQLEAPRV